MATIKEIEEKARRYDEAIEKAKGVIEQNPLMEYLRKGIEYIFPELKESEDEKIRKGIIRNLEYLMDRAEGFVKDELKERIAWLERQGEKKSIDDLTPQEVMDIAVAKCFEQGEQKPAVEMKTPEESLGVDSNTYNKIVDECIYGEQKPAWSEEDKDFMYDTLSNLTELKDRYGEGYGNVGKCIDWLKSLKERYVWKPSDEQMNAIDYVKNFDYGGYKNMLVSLYYDLKKLK